MLVCVLLDGYPELLMEAEQILGQKKCMRAVLGDTLSFLEWERRRKIRVGCLGPLHFPVLMVLESKG